MHAIIYLERFDYDKKVLINKLKSLGKVFEHDKYLELKGDFNIGSLDMNEIKKVITIESDWKKLNMNSLKKDCLRVLKSNNFPDYKVITHFVNKIPLSKKSVIKMINPYVKREGFKPQEESNNNLFVEFRKEDQVEYRTGFFVERGLKTVNVDYSKLIVIIEEPRLLSELSDFLRVCHIFKLPLYIITNNKSMKRMVDSALKITKGIKEPKIIITDKLPECFIIGFSKLGAKNESELPKLFKKSSVGLLFGNDTYGLSAGLRAKSNEIVHLTPDLKKPLRGSQALTYVLGFYTSYLMV